MKPGILTKWQEAAQELWEETPELQSRYNFDLQAFLNWNRTRLEACEEWQNNPHLQQEFFGDFSAFLTYKKTDGQSQ